MKLPGNSFEEIKQAIVNGFPNRTALATLTRLGLHQTLNEIAPSNGNLHEITEAIITWAEAHDRIGQLCEAACKLNLSNRSLKNICSKIQVYLLIQASFHSYELFYNAASQRININIGIETDINNEERDAALYDVITEVMKVKGLDGIQILFELDEIDKSGKLYQRTRTLLGFKDQKIAPTPVLQNQPTQPQYTPTSNVSPPISLTVGTVSEAVRRHETLTLILTADDGNYRLGIADSGERPLLGITAQKLADLNAYARAELLKLIHDHELGEESYTRGLEIPQKQATRNLQRLAILGNDLWRNLFASSGTSRDGVALGERLRAYSKSTDLSITVSGNVGGFPWQLLYDRDPDNDLTPEGFWGLRHILALQPTRFLGHAPLGHNYLGRSEKITALTAYNHNLDADAGSPVVAKQANAFIALGVSTHELADEQEFRTALANGTDTDLIYLYCHIINAQPGQQIPDFEGVVPPGAGATRIIFTDSTRALTLDALSRAAPLSRAPLLKAGPLVVLNACGSAALSPFSYDGLAPYFLDLGARAVIGTETDTPVLFGADFGPRLLNELLHQGKPLGAALRAARRHYAAAPYFNYLGLLYTLYGNPLLTRLNSGR